jgi:hypothetical protein
MTSDDVNEPPSDRNESGRPSIVNVPVGRHVLPLPAALAEDIAGAGTDLSGVLDGTRVWLRRSNNRLILHVGDIDSSTLD